MRHLTADRNRPLLVVLLSAASVLVGTSVATAGGPIELSLTLQILLAVLAVAVFATGRCGDPAATPKR